MRRFLLFILAVLYLGVSSGFALNYHYCMGKLAEVSLQYLDTCPSCGEAGTSHKCCSTETEYVKLSVDQDVANTLVQLSAPVAVVLLFDLLDSYKIAGRDETTRSNPFIDPPKENSAIPLFVHHCTFLI